MWNYDDLNFECKHREADGKPCGELFYREDADRIALLTRPQFQGGMGIPPCLVCGRVSIPNNGGYVCIHCSSYYELPNDERPPTLYLMPRAREAIPNFMIFALIMLAGNLVVSGALFFGG